MATNIEFKARCADLATAERRAVEFGAEDAAWLMQIDTYFVVPNGRLKLREINNERAELIHYFRENHVEIRRSDYSVIPLSTEQAAPLREALTASLGVRVRVAKRRHLLMWNEVRIHLDVVEGLGSFIELEALVGPNCDAAAAEVKAEQLKQALAINDADRISTSYSDLLPRPCTLGRGSGTMTR